MPLIKTRCPSSTCGKTLRLNVRDGVAKLRCRCPGCQSTLTIALNKPDRPAPVVRRAVDEDEGGSYGLAQEDNLGYLLRREQDGFKLSADERAAKFRLIDDRLLATPDQCPACEERMSRRAVVCVKCGLNVETGKRLTTSIERRNATARTSGSGGGGGVIVVDDDLVEDVAESVLDIIVTIAENL